MNTAWKTLCQAATDAVGNDIDWAGLDKTVFAPYFDRMKNTPQNPVWHGEGDVWTHTRMVCTALTEDPEYRALSRREQEVVFLAALLHDVGKPACTTLEEGIWRSPNHTSTGAKIAREVLWSRVDLAGSAEAQSLRESICMLIRYHSMPLYLAEKPDPERVLIEMASVGELAPDFSLKLLRLLVRADIRGRLCDDIEEKLESAELAFLAAEELGILEHPYRFPDAHTRHAYLAGRAVPRDYALYDDTWQGVILLSGLPGTGKDTWIRAHYPELPMISPDDIRRETGISPADREGQGKVISLAKERARVYLRRRQPFIWNATNTTAQTRGKLLRLCESYNASVRVVFLETDMETELARNSARENAVPEEVITSFLAKLEPPQIKEATVVEWMMT